MIAVLLCACGTASAGDSAFVHVTVELTSSAQITRVAVTATPGNASADLTRQSATTFSGTLTVSAGTVMVTANAFAGTTPAATGTGSVAVTKGQTAQILITAVDSTGPAPGPDHSPVITSLSTSAKTVMLGAQVLLAAVAMDADGDAIAFAWSAAPAGCGTFAAPASASTTWTAAAVGTCAVTLKASARGLSDNRTVNILVNAANGGAPTLVQHLASSTNPPGLGIPGNNFRFYLPNPVRQGNCLILGVTYASSASRTISISDSVGNDWTGKLAASAKNDGTVTTAIYVLPNAKAGTTKVTVGFDGLLDAFQYTVSEYYNIDPVSPVNGTSSNATAAAVNGVATLSSGNFTPGNNDANGGNLIWSYFVNNSRGNGHPTDFTAGPGFISLHSDIGWAKNQGMATASEYTVQARTAQINPGIVVTSTRVDTYNAVSVALKAAVLGTAPPDQGIRIVRQNISSLNVFTGLTAWDIQFPSVGNLLVVTTPQASVMPVTSVTDSNGNPWVRYAPDGEDPQIWYAVNAVPAPNLKITFHMSKAPTGAQTALMYDIVNADTNPVDATAEGPNKAVTGTHLVDSPVITPGSANGLTIAAVTLGQGPISQLDTGAPAGAIFDYVYYDEELDTDLMDNADGRAHYYNGTDMTAEHWNWLLVGPTADNNYASTAVHFRTAPQP